MDEMPDLTAEERDMALHPGELALDMLLRNDIRWGYSPSGAEQIRLAQAAGLGAAAAWMIFKELGALGQINHDDFVKAAEKMREKSGFGIGSSIVARLERPGEILAVEIDHYVPEGGEK